MPSDQVIPALSLNLMLSTRVLITHLTLDIESIT